jgi:hypothetical protein
MFLEYLVFLLSVEFHQNFVLIIIDMLLSSRKREALGNLKTPSCFKNGGEMEE